MIRATAKLFKKLDKNTIIILNFAEKDFPKAVNLPYIDKYVKLLTCSYRKSVNVLLAVFSERILKNKKLAAKIRYRKLLSVATDMDYIIVLAGDNFDISPEYNFTSMDVFYQLLKEQSGGKLIMYGSSISKENINKTIVTGFNNCDVITARDTVTLKNLTDAGVKNVKYFPDAAFIMEKESCPLPDKWKQGKMVGINLSNLILRSKYGGVKEQVLGAYYKMIDSILEKTDFSIALIPHVMNGADLSVLKLIYDKYKGSERILLIDNEDLTAPQLKYIISNCEVYVGARTHSTIAAYSTCVPTLVIGYSVKSKGIATDLFGTDKHFVVPVYNVSDNDELSDEVMKIINNRGEIRKRLEEVMPGYISDVYKIKEFIK